MFNNNAIQRWIKKGKQMVDSIFEKQGSGSERYAPSDWTQAGDGTQYPAQVLEVLETQKVDESHTHKWKRGILPGSHLIKTCLLCGVSKDVEVEEWNNLA